LLQNSKVQKLHHELTNTCNGVGFKVLTAVTVKTMASWVVMLCSSETAQHFKGTYCLHLQVKRVSQARKQQKQSASYSLILKMEVIFSSKTSGAVGIAMGGRGVGV
jgi:hypothetical protein